jgi:hypothetical protein
MAVSEEQRILAVLSEAVSSISNRPNNSNNNNRNTSNNRNISNNNNSRNNSKRTRENSRSSEESVILIESTQYDSGFDFTIDSLDYNSKKFIR